MTPGCTLLGELVVTIPSQTLLCAVQLQLTIDVSLILSALTRYDSRLIFYDICLSSFSIENKTAPLKIHSV